MFYPKYHFLEINKPCHKIESHRIRTVSKKHSIVRIQREFISVGYPLLKISKKFEELCLAVHFTI